MTSQALSGANVGESGGLPMGMSPPAVALPKGGGAIRGIGEKFAANPVTGTGSMSIPIATSPGRSGFGPQLSLSYDSGAGNGPLGLGWNLSLPAITRKTDKGLPKYLDAEESDVFILSGAEDLVLVFKQDANGGFPRDSQGSLVVHDEPRTVDGQDYRVRRYRPRIEGLFARIERWTNVADATDVFWRSISKDNITTWYGRTAESRIADPTDTTRIFTWLLCQSHDDKGNVLTYGYKPEDSAEVGIAQAHERNRTAAPGDPDLRSAQRYLKRIRYGNHSPYLPELKADAPWPEPSDPCEADGSKDWFFELVLDYGEHKAEAPTPDDPGMWPVRDDPFSSYRAGFEVRTYRLCQRVLMFHHFPGEAGVGNDCLVRSTDFDYSYEQNSSSVRNPVYTFLLAVTQSGYRRAGEGYLKRSLPPVEYEYTLPIVQETVQDVDAASLENLPIGLDGSAYQWTDLHGEGIPGILTEQADVWFYKRNISPIGKHPVEFAPLERVAVKPELALAGGAQFMDLAGDGQPDLVTLDGPMPGFYEHDEDEGWEPFRPFTSRLSRDMRDANLRLVDLDGDGHADVMITEDNAVVWHASLAEEGFGEARRVAHALDEEQAPRLVFADGTQSIYLADLSGDGLTDLARIRNGEVCYWPNLGYGRFGAKVTMEFSNDSDQPGSFDNPDQFDQRRIRLADIDGSGTTDIIYLHRDGVRLYFNQSGNSWSAPQLLRVFPRTDDLVSIVPADLLGNGTACLVWSSPLVGDRGRQMRYINLMGEQKPHLLIKTVNNLGAETRVDYAPSTKFYLQDKRDGRPWITRLPFPVHVVEKVETWDHISRNRFVTRYAYHHGYFDGFEREFRGFGMVEQWDTEEFATFEGDGTLPAPANLDAASHVPPVLTRTWFHTGAYVGRNHVSDFFAGLLDADDSGEYYREPGLTDEQSRELILPDTVLPDDLSAEEEREACRALKGAMLRQEVYALGSTDKEQHPYTVTEQNFTIEVLQRRGDNRHSVLFTHAREAITYHYERNPDDPRIAHALTLEVDAFGNVLKSAAIGYGRRQPDMTLLTEDRARQAHISITYTENRTTNAIAADDESRTPLLCETRTYELTGLSLSAGRSRFTLAEILSAGINAAPVAYEQSPDQGVLHERLIEHVRTLYRRNDFAGALAFGELASLALPFESYKLAFTPGLLTDVYGQRVTEVMVETEGRYVHSEADANWWIPSGRIFYSPDSADSSVQELAHARQHFFLPQRYRDPFHTSALSTESFVAYDAYDLLMLETRDALGNRVTVGERDNAGNLTLPGNDYRVLRPRLMMDPNRNRAAVAFDALGLVVGTAIMGKPEETLGDSLAGFEADLTEAAILGHLANPLAAPQAILGRATTRLVYDLFAYYRTKNLPEPQPAVVHTLARETHDNGPVPAGGLKIQHSFSYSDGFGREIQKKIQAEPGPVPQRDSNGKVIVGINGQPEMTTNEVSPRWVGSGWTVFNNKGKPVRQYEPVFADTHRFEFDVRIGVSPVLFYDPVERLVATLHPNHTWEKVTFDPWRQETWDVSDTVLVTDPRTDADVGEFFQRLPDAGYLPTWHVSRQDGALGLLEQAAARKAAVHAGTPTVAHADSLGRAILTVTHNRYKTSAAPPAEPATEEFYSSRVIFDIEGNEREVIDAKGRIVMRYDYDMLGTRVHQASMEAGERWMLNDVAGKPIRAWDSRGHTFRNEYDELRRPMRAFVTGADPQDAGKEILFEKTEYGEGQPNDMQINLRARVFRHFDGAGVVTSLGLNPSTGELEAYDFKGNLLRGSRQLAQDYKATPDWSANPALESEIFTTSTTFDALNRPATVTTPDNSVIHPLYNEANLLERVEARLRGAATATTYVRNIDYDAKGQREFIEYGNGVKTNYTYDPFTFRLTHLQTLRGAEPLQDLSYTYDPVGNITHIQDDAQQTIYFRNRRVEPGNDYTYDAVYRLIEATGREHLGQNGGGALLPPPPSTYNDWSRTRLLHPGDGNAMGTYFERYVYDAVGNFLEMIHRGSDPANPDWKRAYTYDEPSLLEPVKTSNRLSRTIVGPDATQPINEVYTHDAHGNMTRMPHLQAMEWNFKDQLSLTQRQKVNDQDEDGIARQGERTYYTYDAAGQRVRKVTENGGGQIRDGRVYLGAFEIYRRTGSNAVMRETLHIMDDKQRVAMVETRVEGDDGSLAQLVRYQVGNHLGSASEELDDQAQIISYEEYTPYGSTSYQAMGGGVDVSPKRYRYTGKEREEETGFSYHVARYYAAWLGRWTSPDPIGIRGGANLYEYGFDNPARFVDAAGTQPIGSEDSRPKPPDRSRQVTWGGVTVTLPAIEPIRFDEDPFRILPRRAAQAEARQTTEQAETIGRTLQGILHAVTRLNPMTGPPLLAEDAARTLGASESDIQDMQLLMMEEAPQQALSALVDAAGGKLAALRSAGTESAALLRARSTAMNARGVEGVTRTTTEATGKEIFIHTTMRAPGAHTQGSAALNIFETKSINLSPKGAVGQWGEGAYAYEGSLANDTGSAVKVQFSVPEGTAIERITIPGQRPIVRLVPAEGNALGIVNPVTNLSAAELETATKRLRMIQSFTP